MPPKVSTSVDTTWANGLRGIASLFVVTSHLVMCFARSMIPPSTGTDAPIAFHQLPYIRLLGQGNAWVAVFFVLLGYVNALKAIQCSRAGKPADSLANLARSSFRRTGRLMFPAAAVTIISWLLCQLGFLQLARRSDAFWMQETSPPPCESWFGAVWDLTKELIGTWMYGANKYDQPQWALQHLFSGSMYIYVVLLCLSSVTGSFRLLVLVILYFWNWFGDPTTVRMSVTAGMILSELSYLPVPQRNSRAGSVICYAGALLGLYLCGYPDQYASQTPWSRNLEKLGLQIFAAGSNQGRYWPAIGAHILAASILYSSSMRRWMSTRHLCWLGSVSFPIYLIHGTLIRTVLAWITFGPKALLNPPSSSISYTSMDRTNTPPVDPAALANNQPPRIMPSGKWATPDLDIIPQPASAAFIFILPIFAVILLFVSNLWLVHVEPWFGVATAWCERFATTWRKGRDAENAEFGGEEIISIKSADGQASVHISPRSSPRGSLLPMTEKPVHD